MIQDIIIFSNILIGIYIIFNEYKKNIIPNTYLLLLFSINTIHTIYNYSDISILPILIKSFILIIIFYIAFKFKIWTPSYIKYIFVSSIFFLGTIELTYISNIFFSILMYIILFFFYYYIGLLIKPKTLSSIIKSSKDKKIEDFKKWAEKNKNLIIGRMILIVMGFFAVFILIRMIRFYLEGTITHFHYIFMIDNIEINSMPLIIIFLFAVSAVLFSIYYKYLIDNYKILSIVIVFTSIFIIYEYIYDYEFISTYMYRIMGFILLMFVVIHIIIDMGKYLFFDEDSKVIDYKELKKGDIIDKKLISTYLVGQKSLEKYNIKEFIKSITNPISKENSRKLKKYIKINSNYHEKLGDNSPPNVIKIYNRFLFTPFILIGFIVSFTLKENLLIMFLIYSFKKIMGLEPILF